ncbi:diguanylate cyclase [Microbulbifer taiwanensis]|uniref:Diguanylate cyclase n=1 Tax=Microbulbifer taiwanensis TaxID=986746 RepID=A0ABW1YRX7_9GAMM|nr:diguanylate cyclase [Microbulbifer taiwanensis]
MAPELVSLLNSYSVPAGICNNLGNWIALNSKLQRLLAEPFHDKLSGYLSDGNTWQQVQNAIGSNRQAILTDTRFRAPLADRFAQATRIDILGIDGTNYLIEFFCRSEQAQLQLREKEWDSHRALDRIPQSLRAAEEPRVDPLTGLPDVLAFEHQLNHHWNLALCQRRSLTLLLVEIALARAQADALARARSNTILQRIAICLQQNLGRWNDFAARTGDRSFAILLPGTDRRGAIAMAERLLEAVSSLEVDRATTAACKRFAVAIGSHSFQPTPATSAKALLECAESALRRARDARTNCAFAYSQIATKIKPARNKVLSADPAS